MNNHSDILKHIAQHEDFLDDLLKDVDDYTPANEQSKSDEIFITLEPSRKSAAPNATAVLTSCIAATPSAKPPAEEGAPTPIYLFPVRDGSTYANMSFCALKMALHEKIQDAFGAIRHQGYDALRADLCAIQIELNRLGVWAPRFRGMPRLKRGGHTPGEENMLRDRQVIDLHWLFTHYKEHEVANRDYEAIFQDSTFEFELAERFACEPWRACTKATYLNLSPMMEWELSAIQSERVRKKWTVLQDGDLKGSQVRQLGAKQVRMRLVVTCRQQGLISSWVNTWIAASICERSWVATSEMLALMTGEAAPDVTQVARTHKALSEALARYKATRPALIPAIET